MRAFPNPEDAPVTEWVVLRVSTWFQEGEILTEPDSGSVHGVIHGEHEANTPL